MTTKFGNRESIEKAKQEKKEEIAKYIKTGTVKAKYLGLVSSSFQNLIYKVYTGKASRPDCIKAKCLDCSCFNKEEIKLCTSELCPLFAIRPYQN